VHPGVNGRKGYERPWRKRQITGAEGVAQRRRRALERVAGALPAVWPLGALDALRDEWH